MSDINLNKIVYSKNVIEFITVANEYCNFLESADNFESYDFISRLQKILPLLYLKTSLLPEFESVSDDELEKFVTELDYNIIQQKVLKLTAGNDDYQEVFEAGMQFSEESITASISENLVDIYQDLKDLVLSYRTLNEEVMLQSLSECQINYMQFWGQKLVNCLRAIHNVIYNTADKDSDEKLNNKTGNTEKEINTKPDWLNDRFSYQGD